MQAAAQIRRDVDMNATCGHYGRWACLYEGDSFSGRGARKCEWAVDREESGVTLREHYREEYQRTTKRLARLHREVGRGDEAVPLLKALLQSEPTLEDVVRDLYQYYRDVGDFSSIIREDRHLRQALRDVYGSLESENAEDIPPEPETLALFNEIRAKFERGGAATRASESGPS